MPSIIETTVYCLDELPEAAKEKARAWYREGGFDYDWFDYVYEDFERVCDILGVRHDTTPVRLFGGGTRRKPRIRAEEQAPELQSLMRNPSAVFCRQNKTHTRHITQNREQSHK